MTETTHCSPAILKREGLRYAGLPLDGDWPDAMTALELARLQYPCDNTMPPDARKLPRRQQYDFIALVEASGLQTVTATRQASVLEKAIKMRQSWVMGEPRAVTTYSRTTETREVQAIERPVFVKWLRAESVSPSDYVRAWLGQAWQEEALKTGTGKTTPAENPKRQKLRAMIERIEGLDPGKMPGEIIDFHALALAYDKDFQVSPATFSGYLDKPAALPKVCSFMQGKGRNPEYYRSICNQIGVTVADYDRALKDLEKQKASAKTKRNDGGKE